MVYPKVHKKLCVLGCDKYMKQTLKILILSCVVFLGLWSVTSAATNITVKSCPSGSTVVGCDNGLLNPGSNLVLEFQNIDTKNITGVVLTPTDNSGDKKRVINATANGKFVIASIPNDLKAIYWSVGYIENKVEKLASSNVVLGSPSVGGGTGGTGGNAGNAGGSGGTSAYQDCMTQGGDAVQCADKDQTPGSGSGQGSTSTSNAGASGGGGVRTGLSALQSEFPTSGDIAGAGSIGKLIVGVIKFLLAILLALTVLMIVIGGFMFVTSAGNEDRAKSGRKTITYAIIGLIVVILSWMIVNVVERAVSSGSPIK